MLEIGYYIDGNGIIYCCVHFRYHPSAVDATDISPDIDILLAAAAPQQKQAAEQVPQQKQDAEKPGFFSNLFN